VTSLRRYLDADPTVLVVGSSSCLGDIDGLPEYDLSFVADGDVALDALGEHVVCVLTTDSLPDRTGVEFVREIRDTDDAVSTLVAADEDSGASAAEIGAVGAQYVPPNLGGDRLETAVQAAAKRGEHRRSDRLLSDAFEQFLAANEETFYVKNAEGRYVAVSDPSNRPDPSAFLGKTDLELSAEREEGLPNLKRRHEDTMSVVETGEPIVADVQQFGSGEATFWIEHTVLPWTVDGEITGVIGIERGVSSRYRDRQEMQTRIDQLEQFTSYVAHDLRSPLQVVSNYLELAREGDDAAFERLEEANDRMQQLIDDLETLVGGESDHIEDIRTVRIAEIARDLWGVIGSDRTTIEIDIPEKAVVSAPESTIRPILENLFRSAVPDERQSAGSIERGSNVVRIGALDDGFYVEHDSRGDTEHDVDDTETGFEIVENAVQAQNWTMTVVDAADGGRRYEIHNCMMVTDRRCPFETAGEHALETVASVGDVHLEGDATYEDGVWTVSGAGNDIYDSRNDFQFVYTELDGPVRIRTRLLGIDDINPYSKAGIMIRDSLSDDATHGYVGQTPGHGTEALWCTETGGTTTSQQLEEVTGQADWLELVYDGERVTLSVSTDGEAWVPIDQRSVPLSGPVYVGLAVCSVVPRALCTARFANVSVTGLQVEIDDRVGCLS